MSSKPKTQSETTKGITPLQENMYILALEKGWFYLIKLTIMNIVFETIEVMNDENEQVT